MKTFTEVDMTCGLMAKEVLDPEHKKFGIGSASREFAHRRCRRRLRGGVNALTQRIWCVASGYMIHWTDQY